MKTTTHQILRTKGMARKNNFTSESIIPYNPQREKALSTSNKEVRISGTCNNLIPKKSILNINNLNRK